MPWLDDVPYVFEQLRKTIPATLPDLEEVVWDGRPKNPFTFVKTVTARKQRLGIDVFAGFLFKNPFNTFHREQSGEPVPSTFYDGLYEDKELPTGVMMATSAEHCFLTNSPAFMTQTDDGKFVIDLTKYHEYDSVPGYMKYGGKVELSDPSADAPVKILSIAPGQGQGDVLVPGDADYATELNVFLSTFSVHVVVSKHAVGCHLAVFQRLLVKYCNTTFEEPAKANPRYEFLLQVLFTGTNDVSINEELLISSEKSLVGRYCSLADGELDKLCTAEYHRVSNMGAREIFNELATGSPTWHAAAGQAWTASHDLVNKMLLGLDAELLELVDVDEMTLLIFVGSYYHTFIGDFQARSVMYGLLPFPCTGKDPVQNINNATLSGTIAVTTLTRTYDLNDVIGFVDNRHFAAQRFSDHDQTVTKAAFTGLIAALRAITDTGIDEFHPAGLNSEGELTSYPSINF